MFILNLLSKLADSEANASQLFSAVYTNRYIKKKVASRCPLNASTSGRSMVEMLGVLAIIGVLSVGAIAGYSKAMTKYKLNKHAEAVNMLINNVLQIKDKLERPAKNDEVNIIYYNELFYKMNLLPDGITYNPADPADLEDKYFKGKIRLYHLIHGNFQNFGGIRFTFSPSGQGAEICRNIAFVAKENAADLWQLETINSTDKNEYIGNIYGDAYCGESRARACLRDLDLNKAGNLCDACTGRACSLYVLYK